MLTRCSHSLASHSLTLSLTLPLSPSLFLSPSLSPALPLSLHTHIHAGPFNLVLSPLLLLLSSPHLLLPSALPVPVNTWYITTTTSFHHPTVLIHVHLLKSPHQLSLAVLPSAQEARVCRNSLSSDVAALLSVKHSKAVLLNFDGQVADRLFPQSIRLDH